VRLRREVEEAYAAVDPLPEESEPEVWDSSSQRDQLPSTCVRWTCRQHALHSAR
jgi:hypothetical protein